MINFKKRLNYKDKLIRLIYFVSICSMQLMFTTSCKKEKGIIETQLVVVKQDVSIPTDCNIITFDQFSENDIFAIGVNQGDIKFFITSNGGSSWIELNAPSISGEIQSAVYMDAQNLAFVINNKLYRSFDGGVNWQTVNESFWPLSVFFADKTSSNQLVFVENNNSTPNRVLISEYNSILYTQIGSCPTTNYYYNIGHLSENYISFLSYDNDYYYGKINGFNLSTLTNEYVNINANGFQYPNDAFVANGSAIIIANLGVLQIINDFLNTPLYDYYQYHDNDYYSGDNMGDFLVIVGDKTISTNYNGTWEEAINIDGTGHTEIFRKVKKINSSQFYISGDNGLFIKASFK